MEPCMAGPTDQPISEPINTIVNTCTDSQAYGFVLGCLIEGSYFAMAPITTVSAGDEMAVQGCPRVLTMEQLYSQLAFARTSTAEALCIVTEAFHGKNGNVAGSASRAGPAQAFAG